MAFVSELFDTLRDQLGDPTDTQVPFLTKRLYLNRGIQRMWPHVWKTATLNIAVTTGIYEYSLSTDASDGYVLSVEINTIADSTHYYRFEDYDILPGDEDLGSKFILSFSPTTGQTVRVRYAMPVPVIASASYASSQSELWDGPDRAMSIPPYYALSLIAARKVDDRQDTLRYSTTQASNGVQDSDIMAASQMWMGQFELELAAFERPLPIAKD
jgi:hypothetical protein